MGASHSDKRDSTIKSDMIGAIAGDFIGSVYDSHPIKTKEFPLFSEDSRFTDDSVMTIAVAYALLHDGDYVTAFKHFGQKYPWAGYGWYFFQWLHLPTTAPYNSWGNGSAMRVSPVGFAFNTVDEVLFEAQRSAEVTHNHPEGINGAQATALAILLARKGIDKTEIRQELSRRFGYQLDQTLADIRPTYSFDVSCQGSVPQSIIAFLESSSYEDAIRNAVSLGGDSDTMACMAGGIAQAWYQKIPQFILNKLYLELPEEFLQIIDMFNERYNVAY